MAQNPAADDDYKDGDVFGTVGLDFGGTKYAGSLRLPARACCLLSINRTAAGQIGSEASR